MLRGNCNIPRRGGGDAFVTNSRGMTKGASGGGGGRLATRIDGDVGLGMSGCGRVK